MKRFLACMCVLVAIHGSLACSCGWPTPSDKEKICNAQFIGKVNIIDYVNPTEDINAFNTFYKASIISIYRDDVGIGQGQTKLYTEAHDAICGMPGLKKGQYVLAANMDGDYLGLELCETVVKTWAQMAALVKQETGTEPKNDHDLVDKIQIMCAT